MKTQPILLVEDDDNDVLFLQNAFKKARLLNPLQVVSDGQSALDYLEGVDEYADRNARPLPYLVLLDLNLPHRTGFEVLRWIRGRSAIHMLIVVIFTSSTAEIDARQAYDLGANSYVIKPSNPNDLQSFLRTLKDYWIDWNYTPPT